MVALIAADGACPAFAAVASSTGRVGHLTDLGVDGFTETLAVECKNRESIGDWIFHLAGSIRERAVPFKKLGIAVIKKNHQRPLVVMDLEDFCELLAVQRAR